MNYVIIAWSAISTFISLWVIITFVGGFIKTYRFWKKLKKSKAEALDRINSCKIHKWVKAGENRQVCELCGKVSGLDMALPMEVVEHRKAQQELETELSKFMEEEKIIVYQEVASDLDVDVETINKIDKLVTKKWTQKYNYLQQKFTNKFKQ